MTTTMIEDLCGLMTFEDITNKSNVEKLFPMKNNAMIVECNSIKMSISKMQNNVVLLAKINESLDTNDAEREMKMKPTETENNYVVNAKQKHLLVITGGFFYVFKAYFFIFSLENVSLRLLHNK